MLGREDGRGILDVGRSVETGGRDPPRTPRVPGHPSLVLGCRNTRRTLPPACPQLPRTQHQVRPSVPRSPKPRRGHDCTFYWKSRREAGRRHERKGRLVDLLPVPPPYPTPYTGVSLVLFLPGRRGRGVRSGIRKRHVYLPVAEGQRVFPYISGSLPTLDRLVVGRTGVPSLTLWGRLPGSPALVSKTSRWLVRTRPPPNNPSRIPTRDLLLPHNYSEARTRVYWTGPSHPPDVHRLNGPDWKPATDPFSPSVLPRTGEVRDPWDCGGGVLDGRPVCDRRWMDGRRNQKEKRDGAHPRTHVIHT